MATRTVKRLIDGVLHEEIEEYDEQAENEARAKNERLNAITSTPAIDTALNDVQLMRAWMRFHSAWDDIEQILLFLFHTMMRTDFFLSRPAFFSQYTHAGRRAMVEEVMKEYLRAHDDERRKLENAIKRVKARSGIRNKLMHGVWGWRVDFEAEVTEVVRFEVNPQMDPRSAQYGVKEIEAEASKMEETRNELQRVSNDINTSKSINAYWNRTSYIP